MMRSGMFAILCFSALSDKVYHINVKDPNLGSYERKYRAFVPLQCKHQGECSLLFWFHGWCGDPTCSFCKWQGVGEFHNFVTVVPLGMADGPNGTCVSWNVGTAGNNDVCIAKDVTDGSHLVYDSCKILGKGGTCNTFTCYDDVHFMRELFADVKRRFNIPRFSGVYLSGGSNGGMFAYYLATAVATRNVGFQVDGIASWYGAFPQGLLKVPRSLEGSRVVHFHGDKDVTIPHNGGESFDGFLYHPVNQTLDRYAKVNGCNGQPYPLRTPFDGEQRSFLGCWMYSGCPDRRVVALCNFHEEHGFWAPFAESITWWFLTANVTNVTSSKELYF
jgi:poly(3-hydroxybutyrate) depolymerase